jgi:hypothetical protein
MHAWLSDPGEERYGALLTLGTNNLSLLVQRIAYDPAKDRAFAFYHKLPTQLSRIRWVYELAYRKNVLASDAEKVLQVLGPNAAPALPQLAQVANSSGLGHYPAARALTVFDSAGEQGTAAIISLIWQTNQSLAIQALLHLPGHMNSPAARQALTNALSHPDPKIRKQADDILAGRVFE